jgi:hypothetical protein
MGVYMCIWEAGTGAYTELRAGEESQDAYQGDS